MPMVGFCSHTSSRRRALFPPCLPSSTSSSTMAASASSIPTGAVISAALPKRERPLLPRTTTVRCPGRYVPWAFGRFWPVHQRPEVAVKGLSAPIQGRLPQELKLHGVRDYPAANRYLTEVFVPDFNRRFSVKPIEKGSAFVPLAGVEVELLLSLQHERVVNKDNTVSFKNLSLQLPKAAGRLHFVRCPVLVHELLDDTVAVSHLGQVIARFEPISGDLLPYRQGDAVHRSAA